MAYFKHCLPHGMEDCPICRSIPLYEPVTKPPLGLKPKWLHAIERVEEILAAMDRYSKAAQPIPVEWVDELYELIKTKYQVIKEFTCTS